VQIVPQTERCHIKPDGKLPHQARRSVATSSQTEHCHIKPGGALPHQARRSVATSSQTVRCNIQIEQRRAARASQQYWGQKRANTCQLTEERKEVPASSTTLSYWTIEHSSRRMQNMDGNLQGLLEPQNPPQCTTTVTKPMLT
jgi:hypothetical protein